jgi:hypothetical protein
MECDRKWSAVENQPTENQPTENGAPPKMERHRKSSATENEEWPKMETGRKWNSPYFK